MLLGQHVIAVGDAHDALGAVEFELADSPAATIRGAMMRPAQPRRETADQRVRRNGIRQVLVRAGHEACRAGALRIALADRYDRNGVGETRAQRADRFRGAVAGRFALDDEDVERARVTGGEQVGQVFEAGRPVAGATQDVVDAQAVVAAAGAAQAIVERAAARMVDLQDCDGCRWRVDHDAEKSLKTDMTFSGTRGGRVPHRLLARYRRPGTRRPDGRAPARIRRKPILSMAWPSPASGPTGR